MLYYIILYNCILVLLQNCQHNTKGDKCDKCADGYYGDPTTGSPNACQKCACPLEISSNK